MANIANSFPLSPGYLFYPSEQQIISYYLAVKNSDLPSYGIDVIKELDLYMYDPFDLPETASFLFGKEGKRKHWYYFVRGVDVERRLRATGNGYWKRDGVKDAINTTVGRVMMGTRRRFVFYLPSENNAPGRSTHWVMYEYELIGQQKASVVLSRVFMKSDHKKNGSDPEPTPCIEKNVLTELRLGAQHENAATVHRSGVEHENAAMVHRSGVEHGGAVPAGEGNEDSVFDDLYDMLFGQDTELERPQNISDPVAQQVRPCNDAGRGAMDIDRLLTQQLDEILEEDFVELNDLTWPPPGFF